MNDITERLKAMFSTKTSNGRMVRTFVQAGVGFAVLLSAVAALPELQRAMRDIGWGGQTIAAAAAAASISRVMSELEALYEKLRKWADGED